MVKGEDVETERIKKRKRLKILTPEIQKTWESIVHNYELIEGAQLSNSFIILMILDGAEDPLTSSDISKFRYVVSKIEKLMTIQGDIGFIIKVGLFSGLREEEIIYSHGKVKSSFRQYFVQFAVTVQFF
jgi:hypothetical protein